MKIKLDCSNTHLPQLTEKLIKGGFEIDNSGKIMVIDNPQYAFTRKDPLEHFKMILWLEAYGNDIHIHYANESEPMVVQEKLYSLEERFKDQGFIRVNKSQIVNMRFIIDIEPLIGQKLLLTMSNNKTIDVNRTYYKAFKEHLKL